MTIQWFILKDRIFFIHPRPGLHDEKIIHVIKFRTMNEKKDESGALLPAMQRITPGVLSFAEPRWMSFRNSSMC